MKKRTIIFAIIGFILLVGYLSKSEEPAKPATTTTVNKPAPIVKKMDEKLVAKLDSAIKQMKERLTGNNPNTRIEGIKDVKGKVIDDKTYEIQIITPDENSRPWYKSIMNDTEMENYMYSREVLKVLGKGYTVWLRVYVNDSKEPLAEYEIDTDEVNYNNIF